MKRRRSQGRCYGDGQEIGFQDGCYFSRLLKRKKINKTWAFSHRKPHSKTSPCNEMTKLSAAVYLIFCLDTFRQNFIMKTLNYEYMSIGFKGHVLLLPHLRYFFDDQF